MKWEHLELNVILRRGWHGQEGVGAAVRSLLLPPPIKDIYVYIKYYNLYKYIICIYVYI